MKPNEEKAKLAQLGHSVPVQPPKITSAMVKSGTTMTCSCGGVIFQIGTVVKKISAIMSPTPEAVDVPIQVLFCKDCGLIHPDTDPENVLPEHIKSKKIKLKL